MAAFMSPSPLTFSSSKPSLHASNSATCRARRSVATCGTDNTVTRSKIVIPVIETSTSPTKPTPPKSASSVNVSIPVIPTIDAGASTPTRTSGANLVIPTIDTSASTPTRNSGANLVIPTIDTSASTPTRNSGANLVIPTIETDDSATPSASDIAVSPVMTPEAMRAEEARVEALKAVYKAAKREYKAAKEELKMKKKMMKEEDKSKVKKEKEMNVVSQEEEQQQGIQVCGGKACMKLGAEIVAPLVMGRGATPNATCLKKCGGEGPCVSVNGVVTKIDIRAAVTQAMAPLSASS